MTYNFKLLSLARLYSQETFLTSGALVHFTLFMVKVKELLHSDAVQALAGSTLSALITWTAATETTLEPLIPDFPPVVLLYVHLDV